MKKIICILSLLLVFVASFALNITTPGTLKDMFTEQQRLSITTLTISGNIDARDFRYMRDFMPSLSSLDLTNSYVKAFTGTGGPLVNVNRVYYANAIPCNAFESKYTLTILKLPKSIVMIDDQALSGTSITTITIPTTVKNIGVCSFLDCSELTSIVIPDNVTTLDNGAFINCTALQSVTIGSGIKTIGATTFRSCYSVTEVINYSSVPTATIFPNIVATSDKLTTMTPESSIYYTLNGNIINNPKGGLFICVTNGVSKKVFIK